MSDSDAHETALNECVIMQGTYESRDADALNLAIISL